jgi:hypothetical protein
MAVLVAPSGSPDVFWTRDAGSDAYRRTSAHGLLHVGLPAAAAGTAPGQADGVPFTVSHAVAVLPLVRHRRLVPAALVIGSWVPDLPYFVPGLGGSGWTHAASGPVTVDLVLGLLVLVVWWFVLRRPLADLAPAPVRERVPPAYGPDRASLLGAAVSIVLGAVTHVVWDTFTHRGRWGTTHLSVLGEALGPLPLFTWLQFGSGVLGLLGLLVWVTLWLARTPRRPAPSRLRPAVRRSVWISVSAVTVVVAGWEAATRLVDGRSLEATAVAAVTRSMGAAAAVVTLASVLWLVFDSRARSTPRPLSFEQGAQPPSTGGRAT